ncbi:MAG: ABC transporter ATP-binding protein [Clostridia bacterium]|nr:ABC transporter ATP-binding protein [Clostridia bacterium]
MDAQTVLDMRSINLIYQSLDGETEALKDFSLKIYKGQFVSLVGPSGCGKTTVLSLVSGLIKATSGEIFVLGNAVCGKGAKGVGYMLQRDQLFPWRTILDNVCIGLEIKKIKTVDNVNYAKNLLEKYGLGEFINRFPPELSGGMRQRVALIRTLALKPELLLLDEPFSALDDQTRLKVCDDVYAIIREEHKTALLVTHDISEAVSLSDTVAVLSPRPAFVKAEFTIDFSGGTITPLQRRKHAQFPVYFDKITNCAGGG